LNKLNNKVRQLIWGCFAAKMLRSAHHTEHWSVHVLQQKSTSEVVGSKKRPPAPRRKVAAARPAARQFS
jgi:hypothetical protein